MQSKVKSKLKSNVMSIFLTLCVSVMCFIGMSMVQHANASVPQPRGNQTWGNLPAALPSGTVNYYKVSYVATKDITYAENTVSKGTVTDKYLKVQKNIDTSSTPSTTFRVWEAATLAAVQSTSPAPPESTYFEANLNSDLSIPSEGWNISLKSDTDTQDTANPQGKINENYRLLSVSPICTTITATKTWEGDTVANDTVVEFDCGTVTTTTNPGDTFNHGQSFWVKKTSGGLQVSRDNSNWNANNIVLTNGQTINVLLQAATASPASPEKWLITITGYDREDATGKLIEYRVDEKDIQSSQPWVGSATTLQHTMSGVVDPSGTFTYTLKLKDTSNNEADILKIEKHMTGSNVSIIVVRGVDDTTTTPNTTETYTTIVSATYKPNDPEEKTQNCDTTENKITFNTTSSSTEPVKISIQEIQQYAGGVTVNFKIGKNNGNATLILKLTTSGRLSYSFEGLPAETYTTDVDTGTGTEISVGSYKVVVTSY